MAFAGSYSDGDAGGRRRTHQLFYSSCNAPLLHCRNAQKKTAPGHIRRTPTQSKIRHTTVTLPKRAKKGNARPYKQSTPHSPKPGTPLLHCQNAQKKATPGHIRRTPTQSKTRLYGGSSYILGVNRLFLRSLLFYTFPIILIDHNLTQFTDQWFFRVSSCTLVFVC